MSILDFVGKIFSPKPAPQLPGNSTCLGRNEPCHCGSGRKYKKCCMPNDERNRPAQHHNCGAV